MALSHSPKIVRENLQIYLDIENKKSYPNSGTSFFDMVNNITFTVDNNTPLFVTNESPKYIDFEESKNPGDNLKSSTSIANMLSQTKYTRCAWFNLESLNSTQFRNIFCNLIGNNSDMSLCVHTNNKLGFHQYVGGNGPGSDADYTFTGNTTLEINKWYYGCIVVDRDLNNIKIYLNGSLDGETTKILGNAFSNTMLIGGPDNDGYSGDRMFDGKVAVIQHYNKALTSSEILENFNALRGRYGI